MIDLSTNYLGLRLRNPLVCSASPLCEKLEHLEHMEEAGAAAVVLHSLFEEQLRLESLDLDRCLDMGTDSFLEANSYFPDMRDYNLGPDGYVEHLRRAAACLKIPVIASLNGTTPGGWVQYASRLADAGADALELNMHHLPTDPGLTSNDVEEGYVRLVESIRAIVPIPLAVKLGPGLTAPVALARRLRDAGANALVLFNRFYQPNFDPETLSLRPTLTLSTPQDLPLRLHWTAILFAGTDLDLAVTGGVHSAIDVVKVMMAGARVAMMTSALLQHGIDHLTRVRTDLEAWLCDHGYTSIRQMQGSMSLRAVDNPTVLERTSYMKVLRSYALHRGRY